MSATIREILDEEDLEIVLDCLNRERIRCKSIKDRPIQGYGKDTEQSKKEAWGQRADQIQDIINRISEDYN